MLINQVEIVSIEKLVPKNHTYRKLKELIDFNKLVGSVSVEEKVLGATGYTIRRLIMCLVLQFMENLSDREFERFMSENIVGKWFCDFGIQDKTPDFTTFASLETSLE